MAKYLSDQNPEMMDEIFKGLLFDQYSNVGMINASTPY